MDEPKQSAARASGFVIPIALGILLIAYVWPEGDGWVAYSRLLGFRVEGRPLVWRAVGMSAVLLLPLFGVAMATSRRVTARRLPAVLGAAALLGVFEILQAISLGLFGGLVGLSIFLTGGGGVLLVVAALGAMDREIRESEGARA